MDCPPEKLLIALVSGELSGPMERTLTEHVSNCDACHEAAEWVRIHLLDREDLDWDAGETVAAHENSRSRQARQRSNRMHPERSEINLSQLPESSREGALCQLGDYAVLEEIARGNMGCVFRGVEVSTEREVALKLVPTAFAEDDTAVRRFLRGAEAVRRLRHPNIVETEGVGEQGGFIYLVMEYVRGKSLRRMLEDQVERSVERALFVTLQIARGLEAAHGGGIIHRDIKPANILVSEDGNDVKIADFGLAYVFDAKGDLTEKDLVVGTPAYMSPEQVRDESLDHRSDLFSMGCILYEMLCGEPPFVGTTSLQATYQVVTHVPPPPKDRNDSVPLIVSDFALTLLEKDLDQRPESATVVVQSITSLREDLGFL